MSQMVYLIFIHQDGTDVERLIDKERYETVSSLEEGIERIAKGKYVFLWTKETMEYLLAKNCTFTTLKGNIFNVEYCARKLNVEI